MSNTESRLSKQRNETHAASNTNTLNPPLLRCHNGNPRAILLLHLLHNVMHMRFDGFNYARGQPSPGQGLPSRSSQRIWGMRLGRVPARGTPTIDE